MGVRELKDHLSRYLAKAREGDEILVTDRGRPIARLVPVDGPTDRLAELIARGLARPAKTRDRTLPEPIEAKGTVSDLVIEQRG
ncbi:prevent-host-death protein [cyanobacterium TDX16]|nr:prevent-host-death protein [cyanobacterium TDX16]